MTTSKHLLEALEPVVAENLDRHLGIAQEWHPHDYVPWSEGRDFAFLGGEDAAVHVGVERGFSPARKAYPAFLVELLAVHP